MNIDAIRSIIKDEILNDSDLEIAADEDLMLSEILNSLKVTLLIDSLEQSSNIVIPPADVTLDNFGTLERIAAYVQTRRDSLD